MAIRSGAFFAATDTFDIALEGLGGHAAKPSETIDTTVMASHLILALQTIASRNADPIDQIAASVTSFETSSKAYNVIPQGVHLKGTVRTMSIKMRILAEERIMAICKGTAATFGGSAEVTYQHGYPVMVNHPEQTEFAADVARSVSGSCAEAALVMGGEILPIFLKNGPAPISWLVMVTRRWCIILSIISTIVPYLQAAAGGLKSLSNGCLQQDNLLILHLMTMKRIFFIAVQYFS